MSETAVPISPPAPPARLREVFAALDGAGLRWSLLRPPAALAQPSGDIDVLVDPPALARARDLAVAHGFAPVPRGGDDVHAADYDAGAGRFLWLHVQGRLRLAGAVVPAAAILDRAVRDPLPRPPDAWLLWIVLLHGLVDKGAVAERHRAALAELARTPGARDCPLAALAARRGLDPGALVALVAAGDWERVERLPVTPPRRSLARRLRGRAAATLDRAGGLWARRGLAVAVIGPDGAGKTSLVGALRDELPLPTRVLYMGLTGGRLPRADALRIPGVVLAARLAILWVRYGVALWERARGRTVIFDRYVLDGAVPSGAALGPLARISRRLQAHACPRPDLVLLLDASGATLHRRSGEYDAATLESWRTAYARLRGSVRQLEVIDAEQPAAAVRSAALRLVWQRYAARWSR